MIGARSRVIDLGRRRRLFTGGAELAVRLGSRCCYWPGCEVPISRTQIDHVQPWVDPDHPDDPSRGGPTDVANGGGLCGRHNRYKQHGFRVCRDPDGTWHTFRPDGTEIR